MPAARTLAGRRMDAGDMSALFDRLGLTGDFWKLG
jgi:hypothetical protein